MQLKDSVFGARISQLLLALFLVAGASAGMVGCEQDSGLENAGESIDEAIEEAGDEFDDNS